MSNGEAVLIVCLAGIAGSAATMVILALREYQEYRLSRRRSYVPPVTPDSIWQAQMAAQLERERFQQNTGQSVSADGRVITFTVRGGRALIH